jgi:hypothetical protein
MRQVGGWSRPWLVAMFWLGTSSPPCMPRCVCGWWGVCGWGGVSSIVQPVHTFFASQPLYDRKFPHTQNLGEVPPSSFCIFLKKQKQKHHAPPQNPPSPPPPFSLSLFPSLHVLVYAVHCHKQGDGVPTDRLKAHELFQAWEEQCATQSAAETCDFAESHAKLPASDCPTQHRGAEAPTQSIREGAELHSQVDNVRQRIAKLSLQLQSPTAAKPPR